MVDKPLLKDLPYNLLEWSYSMTDDPEIHQDMLVFMSLFVINENAQKLEHHRMEFLRNQKELKLLLLKFAVWHRIRHLQYEQHELVPFFFYLLQWFKEDSSLAVLVHLEEFMNIFIDYYDSADLQTKLDHFLFFHPTLAIQVQEFLYELLLEGGSTTPTHQSTEPFSTARMSYRLAQLNPVNSNSFDELSVDSGLEEKPKKTFWKRFKRSVVKCFGCCFMPDKTTFGNDLSMECSVIMGV